MTAVARLLLCHGAGAGCDSAFMQQLAAALQQQQIDVALFEFAYMQRKRELGKPVPPPKVASLLPELAAAIKALGDDLPLFIGGKSMGGRVASLLAALPESLEEQVRAVFAYGYPFHPPRKAQWRTGHFSELSRPLIIMQGERDPFGNYAELSALISAWPGVILHWLKTADHDFQPLKSSGLSQRQLITQAAEFTRGSIDAILAKVKY
ncbi:alpha/beta family hydrolase [Alishewanella sp. HH-ZS]|uniref:alpha/beta family hydrolase n=1 Tax=Alishewanella sp. HH-ZS TaxID=1856684 RepID=UPI000823628F|nr:alpha/beta family hydrolase [Alishewanella sp. HH-ZS]OCW94695.1 alpha/beta hydrolase [Alishewanella sp. HH-ZS]